MSEQYVAAQTSKPREPIRWAAVRPDGSIARTFTGDHAPAQCERWCEDAAAAGEPEADRRRNSRP
jgi:xanthine/CO dehydrogenase XdhC/CoxF family maturation factor